MKKIDMSKITGKKWLMILIIIVLLIIYDGLAVQTSIVSRAVAVGIAIDLDDQNQIELSAQVILPRNGGQTQGGNDFAIFTASGETIQECVAEMNTSIGAIASFAHTTVIVLGKKMLDDGRTDILREMMASPIVSDNVQLVCAEDKAKDILTAKGSINEVSSYHLQRLLQSGHNQSSVIPTNLKTFFMHYTHVGQTSYMPIVVRKETDKPISNGGQGGDDKEPYYLLDVSNTLVYTRDRYCCQLNREQSRGLSYVLFALDDGILTYEDDRGKLSEATLVRSRCDRTYNRDTREVVLTITMIIRNAQNSNLDHDAFDVALSDTERARIETNVRNDILNCYEYAKSNGADVFFLGETAYGSLGKYWEYKDDPDYLQKMPLRVEIRLRSE